MEKTESCASRPQKQPIDVSAVAKLANLEFSEEEMLALRDEMERIIAFADQLRAADTTNVDANAYIVPMKNVFRDDVVENAFTADELLAAAATTYDHYIVVPRVVED